MFSRHDVLFESHGQQCRAWLYVPDGAPAPIVVMAHGLGGVKEMRLDAYADRFAAAGYACLVFDYRHFGASDGEPRQLLDIDKQLQDWQSAVGYARSLDVVDADRIIVWGTSFGGGHAIVTAARDHEVAAAIAQCPFTDGPASAAATRPRVLAAVTLKAIADKLGAAFGRAPIMVPSGDSPGRIALMSVPHIQGYFDLVPDGTTFRNEVAARFALDVVRHRPGKEVRNIQCPILFAVCETDTVAPARKTLTYASTAPKGEIRLYTEGHFDIYVNGGFEKTIADQIAFLHTHVPVLENSAVEERAVK